VNVRGDLVDDGWCCRELRGAMKVIAANVAATPTTTHIEPEKPLMKALRTAWATVTRPVGRRLRRSQEHFSNAA
jgi:hypothetical protein